MAFNTKEQELIRWGIENGKTKEEIKSAIVRFRTGVPADSATSPEEEAEPGVVERVTGQITQAGERVNQAITGEGEFAGRSSVRRGFEAASEAASAIPGVAKELLPSPARKAIDKVGEAISSGVQWLADKIGSTDIAQKFVKDHPEMAKALEEAAGTAAAAGNVAGTVLAANTVAGSTQTAVNTTAAGASKIGQSATNLADDAVNSARQLKSKVQSAVARNNVNPQLEQSASRLFLEGTDRLDDPISAYNKFLEQSKTALTDTKADPAIATVGERMGDAFNKIVAQRRAVGKVMETELEKVGNIRTNVLPAQDSFVSALQKEGLVYDRVSKTIKQRAGQTKMAADDVRLLDTYAQQLQLLGSKPTIGELDAFISRITSEIDLYKSSKAITGTTNGERIIKGSLSTLREQFDPTKANRPELTAYANAREAYSELSSFIEEGASFLGKRTQSGDFAKDASLAKSAVQSVLNNGKKDWMVRLEELTGYNVLDEAVLALQAMKDAGDFRGLSLLQQLAEGAVPTSKAGFTQKLIDFGVEQGAKVLVGSAEEQTRSFLNALKTSLKQ